MQVQLPRIIFGSSALGNLYELVPDEVKREIVQNWVNTTDTASSRSPYTVIDSAGKYGAGLALKNIGRFLKELSVDPGQVVISNKLGWKSVPLTTSEPTFEPGAWVGLENDAVQAISYNGILECYEQGDELLGDYNAKLLSIHDPDEYLAQATSPEEAELYYRDILDGYQALVELREAGKILGIGVGSKDWRVIKRLFDDGVPLDWVMLANSFTLLTHPQEVMEFMEQLHQADVKIINSAVFNAGFLIGGKWFDYKMVTREGEPELFEWRDRFTEVCSTHGISPALACCQFALSFPGVVSLALNTSRPTRVPENVALARGNVSPAFWQELRDKRLLDSDYPHL
ncbi:aldo/keto reductase [Verrucomicrobiaceae bacterium N1E253]|uniref:Aldo/keto reductase n=1 Tax=Oceaniferula marina TaxID=2748318 RepID=A0A851GIY7_9BACT|nr:aldo/keto reductase [Oceaniferula marina]NWK54174.1 aldo/keto reductase [Oceaniferula marina]